MTFYGADVSQLRELAKAAERAASLLSSRAGVLHGQIQSAPWKGADGDRFRQEWTSNHRPGLEKVVASLRENSRLLLQNADEQEKASAASSGGGPSGAEWIAVFGDRAADWLAQQAAAAAAAAEHRRDLETGLERMLDASARDQAAWWRRLSAADRKFLIEGEGLHGPYAEDLMRMDGGIPKAAQDLAREYLQQLGRKDVPLYSETGTASVEAKAFWFHGGAEVGSEVVANADGTATMKVYGNLGLGVNDPSGTAGATLSGEASREFGFGTVKDAMAARDQMYRDLPPDRPEEIRDVAGNPPGYILETVGRAANEHGSTDHTDKLKGTLSMHVEGESAPASGSAKLDLAYERNLSDGTATAAGEVSASGKLNLGGRVFEASGKGGLQLTLDKDNQIREASLSMDGMVAQGITAGKKFTAGEMGGSITAGTQGTVRITVDYSPENRPVIDSYLRNVALGNETGAARDAARLYEAGSATLQVNNVVTVSHQAELDVRSVGLDVKTENRATTNVSTYYKVPNDTRLERL